MAEMDIYHTQKVEDFTTLATEHLDGEIELYEQVKPRISHQSLIIYFFIFLKNAKNKNDAGPTPSTHSAPRVRAAADIPDVPAYSVRRHTQALHLRAGPRATTLDSGPASAAVSARVGRDADAARELRDPGGRRAPVGHRRQCRFWSGQRIWAILVREFEGR